MKKTAGFLLLALAAILPGTVNAQGLRAGFFTGLNIAYLETEAVQTRAQQLSFSVPAGLTISKAFNRWYGLQAELNYVRMGERINGMQQLSPAALQLAGIPAGTCAFADFRNDINLHYLQVPLLIKATVRVNTAITYYALFGPAVSVLVSGRSVLRGSSPAYTDLAGKTPLLFPETEIQRSVVLGDAISLRNDMRTVNLSGIGACGLQVNGPNGGFFLEARLTAGFTNIYRNPARQGENYTNSLACLMGYAINLK